MKRITYLFLISFFLNCFQKELVLPVPEGVLNLKNVNLENDIYQIKGNFGFVYGKFLQLSESTNTYFQTPLFWSSQVWNNKTIHPFGYATYSLKILANKNQFPLKIIFNEVGNSCEIYLNGNLVESMGKTGTSIKNSISETKLLSVLITNTNQIQELKIYVSSYQNEYMSGIGGKIIIGSEKNVTKYQNFRIAKDIFFAGAILSLGVLHLFLAILSRNDITIWSITIFCLWAFAAAGLSESKLIYYFHYDWVTKIKFIYILGTYAAASASIGILSLFKEEVNNKIYYSQILIATLNAFCILIFPIDIFSGFAKKYLIIIISFYLYTFYILFKAVLNNRKNSIYGLILASIFIIPTLLRMFFYLSGYGTAYALLQTEDTILYVFCISLFTFSRFRNEKIILKNYVEEIAKSNELEIQKQTLQTESIFKNNIFTIISHDLRSPIKNLKLLLNLNKKNQNKFTIEKLNREIETSVLEIDKMLEELLNWSASQIKNDEIEISEVNLLKFIKEIVFEMENVLKLNQFKIQLKIQKNLKVYLDKNLTRIILRNLITNSIKNSIDKNLILIRSQKKENEILIEVKDFGIGLNKEIIDKLFKELIKPDLSQEKHIGGFGVGLMLCKEFAIKQGGNLTFDSSQKKGVSFILKIKI